MQDDKVNIEETENDGAPQEIGEELLTELKNEIKDMARADDLDAAGRRTDSEDTRYCYWEGQSKDGRKHAEDMAGKEPFPFEGASDIRIRLADMIINERVMVLMQAVKRMTLQVTGMEISDMPKARKIETILKWLIKNMLGSKWRRELKRLFQYQEGDSPAGAVMQIYWDRQTGMEMQPVTIEMLTQWMMKTMQGRISEEDVVGFVDLLKNPMQEEQAQNILVMFAPHLTLKRAKQIVKELRETGEAQMPVPYVKINKPDIRALRLFRDIYFPKDTTDFQRARMIAIPEWLSEAELKERIVTQGYDEDFVDKALGHAGKSAFAAENEVQRVTSDSTSAAGTDIEANAKRYEIITIYRRAVTDDNVMSVRVCVLHNEVDVLAKPEEPLLYKHGEYPGVFFGRETLTDCLLDSRGVAELAVTEQSMQKVMADAGNDSAQLNTVPPIFTPHNRPQAALVIGPLAQIKRRKTTDYETMKVGEYPRAARDMLAESRRRVDEYFGRISELVSPQLNVLHMQDMVDDALTNLKEVVMQMWQLILQYMDDETLQRIVGGSGLEIDRSREEIQGKFDLAFEFDVRELDAEFLFKLAESMSRMILPMDTRATVQREKLVHALFHMINPTLAEATLQPVEAVDQKEIAEEEINFTKIAAGIEPQFSEAQNHQLRLQVLQGILKRNPAALEKMDEVSKEILSARVKHLQFQLQQQQNAMIGRQGASPALGGQGEG